MSDNSDPWGNGRRWQDGIEGRLDRLESRIEEVEDTMNQWTGARSVWQRLLWPVFAILIAAIVGFILPRPEDAQAKRRDETMEKLVRLLEERQAMNPPLSTGDHR
jgi:hypothetical protein